MTNRFVRSWWAAVCLAALSACGVEQPEELLDGPGPEIGTVEEPIDVTVTMRYEGSCAWLACASVWCGNPGCGGTCSDTQPWVARPNAQTIACGQTVRVCNQANGRCVDALVRDTSSGNVWEGNKAVFNAIGASHGDGTCNCAPCTGINNCGGTYGWGQANVRITDSTGSGTEVVVDNTSAGFAKYGPSAYWYSAGIGYGGGMWYTYVNGTVKSNYAQWRPTLPASGYYTVYAFIPNNYATSQQAPYRIYHNGVNSYATVNQNIYYDQWVSLGRHYFSANGTEYVELSDATGEAASSYRMLGVDAVKFVP